SYKQLIGDLAILGRKYSDESALHSLLDLKNSRFNAEGPVHSLPLFGVGGFGRASSLWSALLLPFRSEASSRSINIVETRQQEHIMNERSILAKGQLRFHCQRATSSDSTTAILHIGCVVEALQYLHRKGIVSTGTGIDAVDFPRQDIAKCAEPSSKNLCRCPVLWTPAISTSTRPTNEHPPDDVSGWDKDF
uniref:Protein kinase domain-containing protein n=1 Tax=Macrostomum lignano TaxID=282301 RepID=A0A1I8FB39_9PLAT